MRPPPDAGVTSWLARPSGGLRLSRLPTGPKFHHADARARACLRREARTIRVSRHGNRRSSPQHCKHRERRARSCCASTRKRGTASETPSRRMMHSMRTCGPSCFGAPAFTTGSHTFLSSLGRNLRLRHRTVATSATATLIAPNASQGLSSRLPDLEPIESAVRT